jgi:putative tricarboxylic transport membrane protein
MSGMLADGRLRGIGVTAEQGMPVAFSNWRGIAGPKSLSPVQLAWWGAVFARTVAEPNWQQQLDRGGLADQYLDSQATQAFLVVQMTQVTPILKGLKLAP